MSDGFLFDVRVLELGDEKGEFCGKLFAGAGADVIKVEPPGGGSDARDRTFLPRPAGSRSQPLFLALQSRQARRHARLSRPPRAATFCAS